ncbi:MAG: rod shape-determining protein MreC [Candidatus Omnitrophica bacterium]|nr:rod shape-determining protein MreC [Candidatus Omnitrophota bacterium]
MRRPTAKTLKTLAVFAFLIFVIVTSINAPSVLRIKLTDAGSPVLKAFRAVLSFPSRLIPFYSMRQDNKVLRARVDLLTRKLEEAKTVSYENERLKKLLELKKIAPFSTIPAQVIGRDPSNWSNSIIIDKGSSQGIKQQKGVMSARGLVGRVVEAGKDSSKILLITDPNSRVGVVIQRNRQGGMLMGRPDGKCKMVYIALDSDAKPGDKVVTAGFGGVFPKGILVGYVMKVAKEPGRLYKFAIIRPAQDLSKVEEVLCIR